MPHTDGEIHVLVGLTGSVAALKAPDLVRKLRDLDVPNHAMKVQVVTTKNAKKFYTLPADEIVHDDETEWNTWKTRTDPVLHIELRRWADIMIIAPLTAHTMAKMCHGMCDNLLTSIIRAWDLERPLLFAPAMDTSMYEQPLTREQIDELNHRGYVEVPAISKTLVCGDTGTGAMAEVDMIVQVAQKHIQNKILGRTWKKVEAR